MGKKYIIELEDKPVCVFDEDTQTFFPRLHRVKGFNSLVFDQNGLDKLTPYTEPEPHAEVTADAYQRGYENGFIAGHLKAEKSGQSFYEDGYQRGLNDAWEAARKIATMPYDEEEKAFGSGGWAFITNHTASEAIEKIRQYEQEKDRQARIEYNFDEIKDVLNTTMKECNVSLDEIAAVLEKMRGEQDE